MDTIGTRLRALRAITGLSQQAFADLAGSKQSTINRYENDESELPYRMLLWYADYFDVSLDYIFCRTDDPQGKLYKNESLALRERVANKAEWRQFIEACFEPNSPMNAKLKEAIINMVEDEKK